MLLFLAGACVFLLLPLESYWPGALPYFVQGGRLDGRPVEVALDRTSIDSPMVEVQIEFSMQSGTFRAAYPEMGPRSYLVGGQEGDYRLRLPREKKLLLDPMGGTGTYELTIGSPYHPLARPARRLLALSILGGLLLGLAYRLAVKRSPRLKNGLVRFAQRVNTFGRLKLVFGAAVGVAASLLYSVVHELGHYLGATICGIEVKHAAWTMFSGESPHVRYATQPTGWADAITDAGGTLLPTILAWILLGAWFALRRRLNAYLSMLLLIPPVMWLFSNISGVIDAIRYLAGHHPGHMATTGEQLGLGAPGAVFFCLVPTLLTVLAYLLVYRALRRDRAKATASG
jgi:hypothetical protein